MPAQFSISREAYSGGVIDALVYHSMSLREAMRRSKFPPLATLNDFLATGRDDVDHSVDCLDIDEDNANGAVLKWPPFELTPEQYESLVQQLQSRYGPLDIADSVEQDYSKWFTNCFEV